MYLDEISVLSFLSYCADSIPSGSDLTLVSHLIPQSFSGKGLEDKILLGSPRLSPLYS